MSINRDLPSPLYAYLNLKIFADMMEYGRISNETLAFYPEIDKKQIRETYEKVYFDWEKTQC